MATETAKTSRRDFLKLGVAASGLALGEPLARTGLAATPASEARTLLKNGLVVDGTGKKGFVGDVLIQGAKIQAVSKKATARK